MGETQSKGKKCPVCDVCKKCPKCGKQKIGIASESEYGDFDVLMFINSENEINYSLQNDKYRGYLDIKGKLIKNGEKYDGIIVVPGPPMYPPQKIKKTFTFKSSV